MSFHRKYRSIIIILILAFIFLITLSLLFKTSGETGFFKKLVLETVAPLEQAVNVSIHGIKTVWQRYIFLVGLEEENRNLRERLALLAGQVNTWREAQLEHERLKLLMGIRERLDVPTITARVVGRERSSMFKTVLINRGSLDTVTAGAPVLTHEGIVGRVTDVSWNTSTVLLLIDYNSNIDALVQDGRAQGILQGAGSMECILRYVQRSEKVKAGDLVVSSGLDGVFPKGLPLGTITSIDREKAGLFQRIRVIPTVDVSKLEEVLIVLKKDEMEQ
ncbi:MAG TPA: rod shape-determining protein MreC [Deltaproteobacteria bacterium]|nr:rod shape-determining protein MreC [Deltaproteobacteria bacterium]